MSMLNFIFNNPGIFWEATKNNLQQGIPLSLASLFMDYQTKTEKFSQAPGKKLGVFTAGMPAEFLLVFDIFPIFPEAYACMCGQAGITQHLIEHAEGLGYSRDLCSYMKVNIGAMDKKYPCNFGGAPVADCYIASNGVCDTQAKWVENTARKYGRPYFLMDVPNPVSGSDDAKREIDFEYEIAQMHDMIKFLEKVTGKRFDKEKFMGIIAKSQEVCRLYLEIYEYRKRFPSPFYFEITRALMFPQFGMWDLDGAAKYYRKVLNDIKKRYNDAPSGKIGKPEKYRLMWEGITLWYNIDFYKYLAKKGAHVVYEPYTHAGAMRREKTASFDETLRVMAKENISNFYTLDLEQRIPYFEQKIAEYSIDGLILHANLSCRPSSTGLQDLKAAIEKSVKIPVLILNCDMDDPRAYAEGQIRTRVDAFIEMIEENKKQKQIQILSGGTGQWQTIAK
jgi:benzoyl-CoA reductase/2-hydroxyglutaryl-CoA dehydratase subunit BcrC/BadD/HgdB